MKSVQPIKVLVVEDDPIQAAHFGEIVRLTPGLMLSSIVRTAAEALVWLESYEPDICLVDLGLPDASGVEVIQRARSLYPHCEVLVVTVFADDFHIVESIKAGAAGYVLKGASSEELALLVHEIRQGGSPISPKIARRLLQIWSHGSSFGNHSGSVSQEKSDTLIESLSVREIEVLRLAAKGLSYQELGDALDISVHTVHCHIKKIYGKLQVSSRAEAIFEARSLGLLG